MAAGPRVLLLLRWAAAALPALGAASCCHLLKPRRAPVSRCTRVARGCSHAVPPAPAARPPHRCSSPTRTW